MMEVSYMSFYTCHNDSGGGETGLYVELGDWLLSCNTSENEIQWRWKYNITVTQQLLAQLNSWDLITFFSKDFTTNASY